MRALINVTGNHPALEGFFFQSGSYNGTSDSGPSEIGTLYKK